MRLIGLTGGIATGKTTVAGMLRRRGADVIDADLLAREVVRPGSATLLEIVDTFGADVLDTHRELDRAALATRVFGDAALRKRLEDITHPPIRVLLAERVGTALAGPSPLVVADIPLLYEGNRTTALEGVLLVACAPDVQRARLMARDGLDIASAQQRIAAQMPLEEKRRRATWIIENNGSIAQTDEHVAHWWRDAVAMPG